LTTEGKTEWQGFCSSWRADGTPAEPSRLSSAVPNWGPGETIHFGHKTLRVVGVRDDDADQSPCDRNRAPAGVVELRPGEFEALERSLASSGRRAYRERWRCG
jgi:hypothetical protein